MIEKTILISFHFFMGYLCYLVNLYMEKRKKEVCLKIKKFISNKVYFVVKSVFDQNTGTKFVLYISTEHLYNTIMEVHIQKHIIEGFYAKRGLHLVTFISWVIFRDNYNSYDLGL